MVPEGNIRNILPDFKPGPLDYYRKRAKFDWKEIKVLLEGEEMLKLQVSFTTLQSRSLQRRLIGFNFLISFINLPTIS